MANGWVGERIEFHVPNVLPENSDLLKGAIGALHLLAVTGKLLRRGAEILFRGADRVIAHHQVLIMTNVAHLRGQESGEVVAVAHVIVFAVGLMGFECCGHLIGVVGINVVVLQIRGRPGDHASSFRGIQSDILGQRGCCCTRCGNLLLGYDRCV